MSLLIVTESAEIPSNPQEILQALARKDLILAKFIELLSQGIATTWTYIDGGKSNKKEIFVFQFGNSKIDNEIRIFSGLKDILSLNFLLLIFS